jgi:E3 ubiquitin-protein ligase EDD1
MDLDLLAESESDSESDQDNQDAVSIQRSAITAATAGSDAGLGSLAHFSEDSGESSNQEEDYESDGGESEEREAEELNYLDEQLERQSSIGDYYLPFIIVHCVHLCARAALVIITSPL